MILGTHFGTNTALGSGVQSLSEAQENTYTQIFTRVKLLIRLLERSNSVLKNGLKIRIGTALKSPTPFQSQTSP